MEKDKLFVLEAQVAGLVDYSGSTLADCVDEMDLEDHCEHRRIVKLG
jgi:hypothetical protein